MTWIRSFQKLWGTEKKTSGILVIQADEWDFVSRDIGVCVFQKGTVEEAWFLGQSRAKPGFGDILLILMKSGRVGRYRVSGLWNPRKENNVWQAHAWFMGYKEGYVVKAPHRDSRFNDLLPVRVGQGLSSPLVQAVSRQSVLADEKQTRLFLAEIPRSNYCLPRIARSLSSQVANLSDGAFVPTHEEWKVRARFEASHRHAARTG